MSLPGLDRDALSVARPGSASDSEGNPTMVLTPVAGVTSGTWGTPTHRDLLVATQRGVEMDSVVAMDSEQAALVKREDRLTVRGKTYDVVAVVDARLHHRVFLKTVEG